jgi:hypothetical protein
MNTTDSSRCFKLYNYYRNAYQIAHCSVGSERITTEPPSISRQRLTFIRYTKMCHTQCFHNSQTSEQPIQSLCTSRYYCRLFTTNAPQPRHAIHFSYASSTSRSHNKSYANFQMETSLGDSYRLLRRPKRSISRHLNASISPPSAV